MSDSCLCGLMGELGGIKSLFVVSSLIRRFFSFCLQSQSQSRRVLQRETVSLKIGGNIAMPTLQFDVKIRVTTEEDEALMEGLLLD